MSAPEPPTERSPDPEAAATCAQSFLSAFSGVFSGATLREGVEATVAELQALQPQCATALSGSGA